VGLVDDNGVRRHVIDGDAGVSSASRVAGIRDSYGDGIRTTGRRVRNRIVEICVGASAAAYKCNGSIYCSVTPVHCDGAGVGGVWVGEGDSQSCYCAFV